MKAIRLNGFGGVEQLVQQELPTPTIKDDEVLIQAKALSINPVDVKTRAGKGMAGPLKDEKPLILGWDISGTITEIGKNVMDFRMGDAVFGMVNFPGHGKTYAEFVAAPSSHLALKPASIPHEVAAATTLAALTAWQALVNHARIQPGQKVLIHAAAGGVGHFAVQFAKQLGAYVVGTSSAANRDFVLNLGADEHIDYQTQRFEEAVSGVDFVLDTLGGETIDRSLDVIKPGGSIISIPSGLNEQVVEKAKARGIHGATFRVQSNGEDMKTLAGLLEKGTLKAHVFKTYSFDQMAEAHRQIETGKTVGKVIVTI
ncbi:NADP-dependent oxidoreductase [Larkinella humicola]|uniref:NADP-dependent oxidoreductase n=1 Tax=Larkinella humicola TaxID=2607654 RepID=A0A5N1J9I2_9BACT|nr:NADP-dependent oxidoreductase [Larkinella humicola]KAA9349088.1 NADP-dependent oxidoreductase [Larkinella humicola]